MPDLLLELFSEEIPARMQARAAEDLKKLVTDGLVAGGLHYDGARAFATPRRLALAVSGLPAKSPDISDERKGPRVGAPEKALEGFLKAAGLASIDEATIVSDDKKGDYYVAIINKPGRAATGIVAELVPDVVRRFPWPKSMRWGAGQLRWVRPLQSILCTFGTDTEEPEVVAFEVEGLMSGNTTRGHRFLSPGEITVKRFDDYVTKLEAARVVLDPERRRDIILNDARDLAFAQGLDLVEDMGLADEVAGLVEWPVVLMGGFEEAFLELPPEVIRTTIRANQKCFVTRKHGTDKLAARFLLVSNMAAKDDGKEIVAGNERVVRARLSDARFFWETDLKTPLADRVARLDGIVFHEKLGSQGERVGRIERLALDLSAKTGASRVDAGRAARLAKADLVTEMVGEFPELQGLMGRYYATAQGETPAVAAAIEAHYKPQGPSDAVPAEPVAITVALADKLDLLAGFWAIDEKPTGSKDPYALRRAALGVIRIVLANKVRLDLRDAALVALRQNLLAVLREKGEDLVERVPSIAGLAGDRLAADFAEYLARAEAAILDRAAHFPEMPWETGLLDDLMAFFADRLKVQLREEGARHDLVDAVFALADQNDLVLVTARVAALGRMLDSEDGANLLAGYRRAANILKAEEKKDGEGAFAGEPSSALLKEPAEIALAEALALARRAVRAAVEVEDFEAATAALARLRGPVDDFFDKVLVNAEDREVRFNRLKLLAAIREATLAVADFSKIGG